MKKFAMNKMNAKLILIALIMFGFARIADAQTTTFTYQGRLTDASAAANGNYDLKFSLFDAASGGTLQVSQTVTNVSVANGIFTVKLDFGATPFETGAQRYLEISAKRPSETAFTTLLPRQYITAVPFAIRTINAASADSATNAVTAQNAQQLGGVAANQYVQTNDSRLSNAREPTSGSGSYIQNTSTQQPASNFNISGNGTAGATLSANIVNAATQFNIGGNRVLSTAGTNNLFAGVNAGALTNSGDSNSFFGFNAGQANTAGYNNTFFGFNAGASNTTGSNNTVIGRNANVGADNLIFATAIGSGAVVSDDHSIVLGTALDRVITPGGIALNNKSIRLRTRDDDNHEISFNQTINGIQFKAFDDFRWMNVRNNRPNMYLSSSGDLGIVGIYGQISDARYKTNVETLARALDTVKRLRGVSFNWKSELNKSPHTQIGFIAQEVEAVLPELVSTDKEGYKSVSYSNAVPVLVEAIKEQQAQIEAQQKQIDEQRLLIGGLKKLVCQQNRNAEVCK